MGLAKLVFILVAVSPLLLQTAIGGLYSPLSPLLSPIFNGICDVVNCGKGKCEASTNQTFGFACVCNSNWSQIYEGDHFRFLPCVVPNCSINYSCTNTSVAPAPAPISAPPTNISLFDPCMWSYCGGGKCSGTSTYEHKCECNEGYGNLFNVSAFPCYKECSLGTDCIKLGISVSNSSVAASPPNLSDNGTSAAGDAYVPKKSIRLFTLMISLAILRLK